MIPDKPAGIVTTLVITPIISSNKNIMHKEEKVERWSLCASFLFIVTVAHVFGPCGYECFFSQTFVLPVAIFTGELYKK